MYNYNKAINKTKEFRDMNLNHLNKYKEWESTCWPDAHTIVSHEIERFFKK